MPHISVILGIYLTLSGLCFGVFLNCRKFSAIINVIFFTALFYLLPYSNYTCCTFCIYPQVFNFFSLYFLSFAFQFKMLLLTYLQALWFSLWPYAVYWWFHQNHSSFLSHFLISSISVFFHFIIWSMASSYLMDKLNSLKHIVISDSWFSPLSLGHGNLHS